MKRPLPFEVMAAMVSRLSDLVHAAHPGVLDNARMRAASQPLGVGRRCAGPGRAAGALVSRCASSERTDIFGTRRIGARRPPCRHSRRVSVQRTCAASRRRDAASNDARRVPGICRQRRLRRRMAVELQRNRRVRARAGRAAAPFCGAPPRAGESAGANLTSHKPSQGRNTIYEIAAL